MLPQQIMRTGASAALAPIVLLLAAGCAPVSAPATASSARSEPAPPADPAKRMNDHFQQITEIRDLIIAGDLQAVKTPAGWMARHGGPLQAPPSWKPYRAELRRLGSDLLQTPRLDDAAREAARMAAVCGLCHRAAGAPVERFMPALVERSENLTPGRMQRNKWAIDRMWEGLVGPSDTAWRIGAEVLVETVLEPGEIAGDGPIDPTLKERIDRVHSLAASAAEAHRPGERAEVMGRLLGTCAGCHRTVGARP